MEENEKKYPTLLDVARACGADSGFIREVEEAQKRVAIEERFFRAIDGTDEVEARAATRDIIEYLWERNGKWQV